MSKYTFDGLVKIGPFEAIDLIIAMSEDEKKQILKTMSFKHHSSIVESEKSRVFSDKSASLKKLLENAD